jgi:fructokinase
MTESPAMIAAPHPYVITLGEALVDWVCLDRTLDLNTSQHWVKAPGGAPANVSVGLARLGVPVQFLGGFSSDLFGRWLWSLLTQEGVQLDFSAVIPHTNTRQAYVMTSPEGNRVLQGFTEATCADVSLTVDHLKEPAPPPCVFYWGSVVQSSPAMAKTVTHLATHLQQQQTPWRVYDPNYRDVLWPSQEVAVAAIKESLLLATIAKLSDDEVPLLYPNTSLEAAARRLLQDFPSLLAVIITAGINGALFATRMGEAGRVPVFRVPSVEMTGAGDGFVAGLIRGLWQDACQQTNPVITLSARRLGEILREASAIGALATTKPGAMASLPDAEDLAAFLLREQLPAL